MNKYIVVTTLCNKKEIASLIKKVNKNNRQLL